MKCSILVISWVLIGHVLQAQGLSNLFSQKEADLKYMLAQVAALQVYIGDAEKGYSIAHKGLGFIGDLKKGEFDLHNTFFRSLKTVNPAIYNYSKVNSIISIQGEITTEFKQVILRLSQSGTLSAAELAYLNSVYSTISEECNKSLSALMEVITDDTLEMTDDQRLTRIDAIYGDMTDKYAFSQSFCSEAAMVATQRQHEINEIDFLKKLH